MNRILGAMIAIAAAAGLASCSKSGGSSSADGDGSSSNLTISGALSSASASQVSGKLRGKAAEDDNSSFAVSLSDLEIYAIAFTNPPAIAQADVDASTGAFAVTLAGAKGSSVTAVFRDKTNNNEVGTIVFKDNSQKGLDGSAKQSSSIVLSDSVSLGNLSIGDDGKVVVDVSSIVSQVAPPAAASAAFDFSGVWRASSYANPPSGYKSTCSGGNNCEGVPDGFDLALIRVAGKLFTPNSGSCDIDAASVSCASTDGTVSESDRYALGIWDASGVAACGHKMGFSEDEARAGGFLHPTVALPVIGGTQMSFGPMSAYNPYFWVRSAATAQRPISDCKGINVSIGGKDVPAYACKGDIKNNSDQSDTGSDGWMVGLNNGGCFDANNKPVMVNNWANISPSNACTYSNDGLPTGFSRGSCDYNADPDGSGANYPAAIQFTCRWTQGQFANASNAPNLNVPLDSVLYHVGPPAVKVNQGSPCGDQADGSGSGLTLDEARCYADYYHQNHNNISATCAPRPRFNWGASTVEDFYRVDFRAKPDAQFIMDIMTYDASGNLATVDTEESESFTVSSGESSSVTCTMSRRIVVNIKKLTATTAVADIRFTGRMASTSAACQGIAKTALANAEFNKTAAENQRRRAVDNADVEYMLSPNNMIFNLTKQ